jgi:hypothetical protein
MKTFVFKVIEARAEAGSNGRQNTHQAGTYFKTL